MLSITWSPTAYTSPRRCRLAAFSCLACASGRRLLAVSSWTAVTPHCCCAPVCSDECVTVSLCVYLDAWITSDPWLPHLWLG